MTLSNSSRSVRPNKSRAIGPIAAMLICVSASASAASVVPATHYDCSGRDTSVRYSATGPGGEPYVLIRIGKEFIKASGTEVLTQGTVLGSLVTVRREVVPDSHTDTLTLVAPDVNVPAIPIKLPAEFITTLFSTRTFTTIGGPGLVQGVVQESSSQPLFCKASAPAVPATE